MDEKFIRATYTNLQELRQKMFNAHEAHQATLRTLQAKKDEIMASGVIDGKNEETRRAQFTPLIKDEVAAVIQADAHLAEVRCAFDIATYEAAANDLIVRWLSVSQ